MAFPIKDTFTFDFEAQTDYPNWTPAQTKEYMNARGEELRVALNAVANLLNATTSDVSGADNTGIPETVSGSGTNVRDRADWLYAQIVAAILGAIPDGSLSTAKYDDGSVTAAKCAADVATQAELDNLAGVGRTTETVKGVNDTVVSHLADYVRQPGYAVDTGTANHLIVALTPAPTSYADGMGIAVKVKVAGTSITDINVNGLGVKAIYDSLGIAVTNFKANVIYSLKYESTSGNFIVQGKGGGGNATAGDLVLGKTATVDTGPITGTGVSAKRTASGSFTPTSGTTYTVAGLAFKPSVVWVYSTNTGGYDIEYTLIDLPYYGNKNGSLVVKGLSMVMNTYNYIDVSDANFGINSNGFTVKVSDILNKTYKWIAYE